MSAALLGGGQLAAQTQDPDAATTEEEEVEQGEQPTDLDELRRRIDILAEEIEQLRSGEGDEIELTQDDARALGLAPSAASLYRRSSGVSIAGYGEMLFEAFADADESGGGGSPTNQLDFLRAIIYTGYRFSDRFLFNSEIELEHADEISVEFAYVDYLAHENLGIRGGMLLVPMGLVNEFHEPTVFIGAKRPVTEQRIIPSTWRENGAGVHGAVSRIAYRVYVVNGLDATGFSASGIRGGRQKGARAKAEDFAFVGRLDVTPTPGVFVGTSLYRGGSGQGQIQIDGRNHNVTTTIFDLHGQAQIRGLDVRGLYARTSIDDAADLNQALGLEGAAGVAETMQGGYVSLGYNMLSQVAGTGVQLLPFYRFEKVDTQATMPAGFERSGATTNTFNTIGVELKPIPNIAVKGEYMFITNDARAGRNQFNLNLGYAF